MATGISKPGGPTNEATEYIVGFYNCTRQHAVLGNVAPTVYKVQFAAKQPIEVSVTT
ncbi:hypothetical protein NTGM5_680062 [Candidatus Nitrotoga sp. M5]|nr:hypothetical protein NTGM5_680062 [Candidatus Nitrotoga sp. M5]